MQPLRAGRGAVVAVSAVGRRSYVVEALLSAAKDGDQVIAIDADPLTPGLHVKGAAGHVIEGGSLSDRVDGIVGLCARMGVDVLISLHDYEGIELSLRDSQLRSSGTRFVGPTAATARVVLDKFRLHRHLLKVAPELTVPSAVTSEGLKALLIGGCEWIIKDREGSASSGLAQYCTPDEIMMEIGQRQTRSDSPPWIVQQYVSGVEYNADLFFDAQERIAGFCIKKKIDMRAGETDRAEVLLEPPRCLVAALVRAMNGLRVTGNVDIDLILAPSGVPSVIDVNPRFGGGYAFSQRAGYDAAGALWCMARGDPVQAPLRPRRSFVGAKYLEVAEVKVDG